MSTAYDNATAAFQFLVKEYGFHDVASNKEYMELVGGNLRISIVRSDRFDDNLIDIRVASVHDEQKPGNFCIDFGLRGLMELVLKNEFSKTDPSISEMAEFLRAHLQTVQSMFSAINLKETKAIYDRLTAEWLRKDQKATDRARRGRRLT